MVRASALRFTYGDYVRLPDGHRAEIIDGELYVTPAPGTDHQKISRELLTFLHSFVKANGLGEVFVAPYDVVLSKTDVVQPDLLFVTAGRRAIIGKANVTAAPDLVVEILSKGSVKRDRILKFDLYARAGVRELWIVDPSTKTVEVFVHSQARFEPRGSFDASGVLRSDLLPGLEVPLSEVF